MRDPNRGGGDRSRHHQPHAAHSRVRITALFSELQYAECPVFGYSTFLSYSFPWRVKSIRSLVSA